MRSPGDRLTMRVRSRPKRALCFSFAFLAVCLLLANADRQGHAFLGMFGNKASTAPDTEYPRIRSKKDSNKNGVNDTDDLILGAREEAKRHPVYRSAYYRGGYPPDTEGVCTDVIWRAFQYAGYDLKGMVDADIRASRSAYPRAAKPDPNRDFRRVPNLKTFFARHGISLPTLAIPGDQTNLAGWQPGDIVTFTNPDHIAILSDIRNADGIPFLLHNDGPVASEADSFMFWYGRGITGHYRFPHE